MVKRRKARTHNIRVDPNSANRDVPKSFVVKAGDVGPAVKSLVQDVRQLLEPNTASRLKERKSNRLKDYIAMAGPLKVTHLIAFSQSPGELEANVNMRLYRMPRGPTLTFKVLRFALAKDVLAASKRPHSPGHEYQSEPLLILNNFGGEQKELKLMTTMFQNLFPAIQVQTMPLTKARRVVLLSYNTTTKTIELRHYLISVRPIGVSRTLRKIVEGSSRSRRSRSVSSAFTTASSVATTVSKGVPDMSNTDDVANYVLGQAGADSSASEAESEAESDAGGQSTRAVDLPANYVGRGNRRGERRAVRLQELGPRIELGLMKIEEGFGTGDVLFHERVTKTQAEAAAVAKQHAAKRKAAAERRAVQEANVKAKKDAKAAKGKGKSVRIEADGDEEEDEESPVEDEFAVEDAMPDVEDFDPMDVLDEVLDGPSDDENGESDEEPEPAPPAKRSKSDAPKAKAKFTMRGARPR